MILSKTTSFAIPAQTTLRAVSVPKIDLEGDLQCSELEHKHHEKLPHRSHLKFPELI